ncbi:MAG TPA: ABC transporter substrate-binding protein [Chloroflexota bacterium]|nr:ABC transporter substrate-binding protein [Chloroflexota bacterium]
MSRWGVGVLVGCVLLVACQAPGPRGAPEAAPPAATPPAAASSAAPAPAARSALETVRVGTINNATDLPFYIAQERGYLREQGLDVEFSAFDSAQRAIAPLGADQLDVAGGGPGPGLFNAILRGVNVRIVADRARAVPGTRFNCLVVRKALLDSGAVRTIGDLRGRVFAENVPGTITTYVLDKELRRIGASLQDLTLTTIPFPDTLNAFANEAADAAFLVEPFITLSEQRGLGQCWKPASELEPDFQIAMILYGPAFAEQRADTARRFMVAYLRAVRDYYRAFFGDGQGRAELLELLSRITGVRDQTLLERMAPSWMDPDGGVNVASLRALQRWYFERGDQTGEVELDRVVDMSFAEYAIARLGRYAGP